MAKAPDALNCVPGGPYEVITSVAAIHHIPFQEALRSFREHLAPGGTLVVVGLYEQHRLTDLLIAAVAVPANMAMGWIKNKGRKSTRTASVAMRLRPPSMSFAQIEAGAQAVLPGVRTRRRLFFRYTLIWRRDS